MIFGHTFRDLVLHIHFISKEESDELYKRRFKSMKRVQTNMIESHQRVSLEGKMHLSLSCSSSDSNIREILRSLDIFLVVNGSLATNQGIQGRETRAGL